MQLSERRKYRTAGIRMNFPDDLILNTVRMFYYKKVHLVITVWFPNIYDYAKWNDVLDSFSSGWNVQHFWSDDGPAGVRDLLPSGEQQPEPETDQFRGPFVGNDNHTIGSESPADATASIQAAHFSVSIRWFCLCWFDLLLDCYWLASLVRFRSTSGYAVQFFGFSQHGYVS